MTIMVMVTTMKPLVSDMMRNDDFLGQLSEAMQKLDITNDEPLEVVIGGSQIYEIEGDGTKWKPVKGTRKYNKDAFIVIRRPVEVVSSQPYETRND